jgi:hypothetical protein
MVTNNKLTLLTFKQEPTSGDAQGKYDMRKFDVEVLKYFRCTISKFELNLTWRL